MSWRTLVSVGLGLVLAAVASAQTPPAAADGKPNLQGVWYFGTATPLERPKELADKAVLTRDEADEFERLTADRIGRTQTVHAPGWLDYGKNVVPDRRTSLIVDPPDGRIPALTPEAKQRLAARAAARPPVPEGPEDYSPGERCLVFGAGPPLLPGPYNNNLQIVQTPTSVVLHAEMIHDARIVAMDGRPQPPARLRFWLGASRGHWEGDTLVVETTNFTDKTSFRGSDQNLRVVERFTLEGPDALRYEYTIDNPTAFTRPFTAAFTMTRSHEAMYEFACHEGNYGMHNALSTARQEERSTAPKR